MNKKTIFFSILLCVAFAMQLHAADVTQGLKIPRLDPATQRSLIPVVDNDIAKGQIIFNTENNCLEYWNGTKWVSLCKGQANITFSPSDPTEPAFPPEGGDRGPFLPSDDPNCTTENPAYTFTVITGSDFLFINVLNEATGEFMVSMNENPTAIARYAIVRITNNCSQEYKEFVFSQDGDDSDCGTTPSIPDILSENGTSICGSGAAYLYLTGRPSTGTFIWTLNGQEVGRGAEYVATQGGTYIVYGDKIGCTTPASKSIQVSVNGGSAPSPVYIIVGENNGYVCSSGGETTLFATAAGGTIVWYKDGVKQAGKTGAVIQAGIGSWFAVVENGACSSQPSNGVTVMLHPDAGVSDILPITFTINGQSPAGNTIDLCSGGTLLLQVVAPQAGVSYTWYAGDAQTGVNLGTGATLNTTVGVVQEYPILQCIGEKPGSCAQAQYTVFSISAVNNPPARPSIISNTGTTMCGTSTQLTAVSPGAVSYIWYKDGVELPVTTDLLAVSELGTYTAYARGAAPAYCVSAVSLPFTVSAASGFADNLVIAGNTTPNVNASETYLATMTNSLVGASYTWADPAPHIIQAGQGTASITVRFVDTTPVTLSLTASNACGTATPSPATLALTPLNPCYVNIMSYSPTNRAVTVKTGTSPALSITAASSSAITYQWYKPATAVNTGGTPVSGQTSSTLTGQSALAVGTHYYYCVATAVCAGSPTAVSDVFTVTINPDLEPLPNGAGILSGKVCFDIATAACGNMAASDEGRAAQKTDFSIRTAQSLGAAPPYSGVQIYTFKATSVGVTNVRYQIDDPEGVVDPSTSLTGTLTASLANGATTNLIINYKSNLNSPSSTPLIVGRDRDGAAKVTLYIVYYNGIQDVKVKMDITIQDCSCGCPLKKNATEWLTFMCYNLGANADMSIAAQVAYTSRRENNTAGSVAAATDAANVHGDLYQWGRKADGHEKRSSQSYATNNTNSQSSQVPNTALDANGQVQGPPDYPAHAAYGKFIKQDAGNYDWRATQLNTLWDGNSGLGTTRIKTANDPCPAGWRVPTQAEWVAVADAALNDRTATGTWAHSGSAAGTPGWLFKPRNGAATAVTTGNATLFLPATGYRGRGTSQLNNVGSTAYYWSSTVSGTNAYYFNLSSSSVSATTNYRRAGGSTVRCVAE